MRAAGSYGHPFPLWRHLLPLSAPAVCQACDKWHNDPTPFTTHMKRVLSGAGTTKQNRTQFPNVYIDRRRGNNLGLRKAGENRSRQMKANTVLLERPARAIASS